MNQTAPSSWARIVLRVIALAVAGIGVYCVIDVVRSLPRGGWEGLIFGIIFGVGFGALCLFVAWKAWFRRSARSVRRLCFVASLILFFCSMGAADAICMKITGLHLEPDLDESFSIKGVIVRATIDLFLPVLVMIVYRFGLSWLLHRLELKDDRSLPQRLWSIKLSLGLIALNIFSAAGAIDFSESKIAHNLNQGPVIWDALFGLAPLILAIAIYDIGVRIAKRRLGISARGQEATAIYEIPPKWPAEMK